MMMYRYAGLRLDASNNLRGVAPHPAAPPELYLPPPDPHRRADVQRGEADWRATEEAIMSGSSGERDGSAVNTVGRLWPIASSRAALFLCLWLVLAGASLADIPAAVAAIAAATWTSLHLLEPGSSRRSLPAIARLALLFLYHSVVAGIDVAGRALNPRLPLHPGFVAYPTRLPRGLRQNVFTTITSLLPGTVPAGDENGQIIYHCLDVTQPVAADLAAEEAALVRAFYND
jgi:multicomponent Na+:H+ antiporter subunit E